MAPASARRASLWACCLLAAATAAAQQHAQPTAERKIPELGKLLGAVGLPGGFAGPRDTTLPFVPPVGELIEDDPPVDPEEERTNFSYGEMDSRLEKIVIGRKKKGKKPPYNGVTPADRVDKGEIKYIVLHSAGGSYEGAIDHLLGKPTAAHFIVSKKGDVTRMVAIKDLANHVRNTAIEKASVGIETETGMPKLPHFTKVDWDPVDRWRMYASLAWLIRAIAKETGVPRDEAHIITHEESDRGIKGAHTDPGPFFGTEVYPVFEARFPGKRVTARAFLMRLVNDDAPPRVERSSTTVPGGVGDVPGGGLGAVLRVRDTNALGVSRLSMTRIDGPATTVVHSWKAGPAGLPPFRVDVPIPAEQGDYRLEAYDLVGNMTRVRIQVGAGASPTILDPSVKLTVE